MSTPQLSTATVFQNAWVVADFESAVAHWANRFGVGPFFAMDYESAPELQYRGAPSTLRMQVALAQAGDVQIELINPVSPEPNVYRDLVPQGQTRFHHVCLWSSDYDADLEAMNSAGYETAMASGPANARFAYFDTSADNGHMIEILEVEPGMQDLFTRVAAEGRSWSGDRPLRPFAELLA
ncbi:MAG: VOC family protein [Pseudomonadota bacterium]